MAPLANSIPFKPRPANRFSAGVIVITDLALFWDCPNLPESITSRVNVRQWILLCLVRGAAPKPTPEVLRIGPYFSGAIVAKTLSWINLGAYPPRAHRFCEYAQESPKCLSSRAEA
jgi:hypothetical protein